MTCYSLASDFNLVGSSSNASPFLQLVNFPSTKVGLLVKPHPFQLADFPSTQEVFWLPSPSGLLVVWMVLPFLCLLATKVTTQEMCYNSRTRGAQRFGCSYVIIFLIKLISMQCKIFIA